jgi:hypothetical protein
MDFPSNKLLLIPKDMAGKNIEFSQKYSWIH